MKRKPQITITEAERLALETIITDLKKFEHKECPQFESSVAIETVLNLLRRSKRKDEEVKQEGLVCNVCKKVDETVSIRKCGYNADIDGTDVWEQICDSCEHEHIMDI